MPLPAWIKRLLWAHEESRWRRRRRRRRDEEVELYVMRLEDRRLLSATVTDLISADDTGISSADNVTAERTPTFTGTSEAKAAVEVSAELNGGDVEVFVDGSDVVVQQGNADLFRSPSSSLISLTINGTDGNDTFVVDAPMTSAIPPGGLILNGGPGDDTLSIDLKNDSSNLLFGTIRFHGDSGGETYGDSIELLNTPGDTELNRGVRYIAAATEASPNSGLIVIDPGQSGYPGEGGLAVEFTGLEPITMSSTGPLTVEVDIADVTSLELKDALATGDGWNLLAGDSAFEDVTFQGYNTLTVMSGDGDEMITLSGVDTFDPDGPLGPLESLSTVNLAGDNVAGDDTGSDTFNIQAAPVGLALNLAGGPGDDVFHLGSPANTVAGLDAAIHADGGAGTGDQLHINDSGNTENTSDGVVTSIDALVSGMAIPVTCGEIESVAVSLGSGNDVFSIESTLADTVVNLRAGGGDDDVWVGGVVTGSDEIRSAVTVDGQSGNNWLVIDNQLDVTGSDEIALSVPGGGIDFRVETPPCRRPRFSGRADEWTGSISCGWTSIRARR